MEAAAVLAPAWRVDERKLRLFGSVSILYFLTQSALGLATDISWHGWVGRDRFLTPPHALLYSGVAMAGVICLSVVLLETWRYHRGAPGVDDETTSHFLFVHAPMGFIITGFGLLTLLLAAPLDNYWHQLYGIDVTLWAPFHVMGLIGAAITGLGMTYALTAQRGSDGVEGRPRRFGFGAVTLVALFAMSGLVRLLVTAAQPGLSLRPLISIGPLSSLVAPTLLAVALIPLCVAAVAMTRPGAAVTLIGLAAVISAVFAIVSPLSVRALAQSEGLPFRFAGGPRVLATELLVPWLYLLPAALVDLAWLRTRGRGGLTGLIAGLGAVPIAVGLTVLYHQILVSGHFAQLPTAGLSPFFGRLPDITWPSVLLGALAGLAAAAGGGRMGAGLGRIWRLSRK